MTRPLRSYVWELLGVVGIIYFMFNYRKCIAHCRNQKRLQDQENDPARQKQIARYVDCLYASGDIK